MSSTTNAAGGSGSAPAPAPKPKCDLCGKKYGFKEMKLRTCTKCGVSAHEACYGLPATPGDMTIRPDPDWLCHACAAVGKAAVVSRKGESSRTMIQQARPTDCALCPIVGGIHAMHPLYDRHGKHGVQRVLRADRKRNLPERLAWVHTICAFGIGSSRIATGCVYGCMADGRYEGLDLSDEEDEDDEEEMSFGSPSPKKKQKKASSEEGDDDDDDDDDSPGTVHHFVICGKEHGEETAWTNVIRECRELRCFLCGNNGCPETHIPIQCCANDEGEFPEHKVRHDDKSACYTAIHIGCARWAVDNCEFRRHYFFPGVQGDDSGGVHSDPVNEIYCNLHAKEVHDNAPSRQKKREKADEFVPSRIGERATGPTPSAIRRASSATAPTGRSAAVPVRPQPSSLTQRQQQQQQQQQQHDRSEKDWFDDIKDDVVKKIKRAMRRGDDVLQATTQVKEHWKDPEQRKLMGMTKAEFNAVWKRVRVVVEAMPELHTKVSNEMENNGGSSSSSTPNRWAKLWQPGESFQFEWDTYELLDD